MVLPMNMSAPHTSPTLLTRIRRHLGLRSRVARLIIRIKARLSSFRSAVWHWLARELVSRPDRIAGWIRVLRRLAPGHRELAWMEALVVARLRGWETAGPLLRACVEMPPPADLKEASRTRTRVAALLPPHPGPSCRLAVPRTPRPTRLPAETGRRIVIYTARFGEAGAPAPLFGLPEGVRCLCFTDTPKPVHGWEMHSTTLSFGELKATPQTALASVAPEAEFSLWLDPDREVVGNLHTFFGRWLDDHDLVMARHAAAPDWHTLAERAAIEGARGPVLEAVLAEAQACTAKNLPRGRGGCDTGVIWRRHGAAEVAELGAAWLALRPPQGGAVDDIAFYRLSQGFHAPALRPAILPEALTAARGDARDTAFTAPMPRLRQPVCTKPRTGKLPITFLYQKGKLDSSLAHLRSDQLSRLIHSRFPENYDVALTDDSASLHGRVVIANSTLLQGASPEDLADLRRRNIALIGDWIDRTVEPQKAQELTANMAFCFRQVIDLSRTMPERPTFYVTHHVNTDIPDIRPPQDRLRTGYFGALENTHLPEALSEVVDLMKVTNSRKEWIDQLGRYNCHWIVRFDSGHHIRTIGGWKPFLKGFVAARCGSPVITTRDDPNAVHYLGDDYPFYANSLTDADLELAWVRVAGAFGGPEWRMALEIMRQTAERSSDEQVCLEFKSMLDALFG